ncbi:hypothetical protein KP509_09G071200 [Ceratopteris richardii]|uniref:Protein kinase domain-containing protein n=1 Tax=Ceratopteris richardii TaxID=49495 RepID=A0A8T2U1G8_CERRI|nr:hypothetical protein KP509_09G071200 [Ceratopteris richardii]
MSPHYLSRPSCPFLLPPTYLRCMSLVPNLVVGNSASSADVRAFLLEHFLRQCNRRNGTCADPGVVRLHDVVEDSGFVHLIMDLCEGGDLFDRITRQNRYTEARAACIMRSLLEALQLCHGMGIVHRDLKPENILFLDSSDASPIKLADFGLALEFTQGQQVSGMAGSTFYVAPEVLQGLSYSTEIDMWSAGVILYVMLSGTPPFWEATEDGTFKAIQQGNLNFPPDPWAGISHYAKDLVLRMLCSDVESRLTTAQALNHPWIVKNSKRGLRAQPHRTWSGKRL